MGFRLCPPPDVSVGPRAHPLFAARGDYGERQQPILLAVSGPSGGASGGSGHRAHYCLSLEPLLCEGGFPETAQAASVTLIMRPVNHPAPGNAALAPGLRIRRHCRGMPERGRGPSAAPSARDDYELEVDRPKAAHGQLD
jgi:hypothetical protein